RDAFHPSCRGVSPTFSSQIGSNQLNGTKSSATSISEAGSVMPAWAYTAAAQARPAGGSTKSWSGAWVDDDRTADPSTQAGRQGADAVARSLASTMAAAPSELGEHSPRRIGSHSIGVATMSETSAGLRMWANGLAQAFVRSLAATVGPVSGSAPLRSR